MPKLRYIAPSGTPIKIADIFIWLLDMFTGKNKSHELKQLISKKYSIKHCFLMSSARAAMAMIFIILKKHTKDPYKNEIILPSYTCYSVPAAVEIAGLKVRICDISEKTLSYDINALESINFDKVLAIVSANLYGNPDHLSKLEEIAKKHDIILLDDSAQSMNATQNQRYAGTFGDIGVYSLDKGKNITSIQGGVIITNNDKWAELIEESINNFPETTIKQKIEECIKIILYSILLRPWLYWIPTNLSVIGLGKTLYTTEYLFSKYSKHLASISSILFSRIDAISSVRIQNAKLIKKQLEGLPGIRFIQNNIDAQSVALRLPVIIEDKLLRDKIIKSLNSQGIGATNSYPKSIAELDEIQNFLVNKDNVFKNGIYISEHIITLPTTPYLKPKDILTIKQVFQEILVTNS